MIFDLTWFPGKNSPNIGKSNRVFPRKGKGDRALILTNLDCPMADVSPHFFLSFPILATFRGKRVVKVGPKVKTLGLPLFHEKSNPSHSFQTMLLFAIVLPLVRMSAILDNTWRSKGPKISPKGPFHGC